MDEGWEGNIFTWAEEDGYSSVENPGVRNTRMKVFTQIIKN